MIKLNFLAKNIDSFAIFSLKLYFNLFRGHFFFRFVKDFDYYQKCMLEREREDRPALKALKRSRHNSGCLCFSGKSRRDSDKPLVSSSIWLFRRSAVRLLSSLCSSICLLFPTQIVTKKPHFLSRSQDFALAQILMHFGTFQKMFWKMSREWCFVALLKVSK